VTKHMAKSVFEAIVGHMAEGVIFLDGQDLIRICNPAAERIRGVVAERILGQSIYFLHPPAMHNRLRELLDSLKAGLVASSSRVIQVNQRYFDNSYTAIREESGDYLGTLLISRDITEKKRLSAENLSLRQSLQTPAGETLIAHSPAMKKVLSLAEAVAGLDSTVLVTGENGTGKERVVELIHRLSPRREAPLVRVNCAALPESLLESELFGHCRGAFTGAVEDRKGKFELADGGTLLLDEIGELPLGSQAKLLRAIQDKAVQPVGGRREIQVDVRIVAATNRDLQAAVANRSFREDLYYRLNVISLEVPPLRQRPEDILPLAEHFLQHFARQMKRAPRSLSPQARAALLGCSFPGNVRQLRHAMERAMALGIGEHILPDDLPAEFKPAAVAGSAGPDFSAGHPLRQALSHYEKVYLEQALALTGGRRLEAARRLGISRKNLWEKMQRYGLLNDDATEM
jgi:PAS domain S-box-containing protein